MAHDSPPANRWPGLFALDALYTVIAPWLRDALVFDVGANKGEMTRRFVASGARVVSVEPQADLVAGNPRNYQGAVAVEHCCVADRTGEVTFFRSARDTISSCNAAWRDGFFKDDPDSAFAPAETQPARTLDDLAAQYGRPRYIKIDVEGFEDKVLAGLSPGVDLISFEYTGGYGSVFAGCLRALQRFAPRALFAFEVKKTVHGKLCRIFEFDDIEQAGDYFQSLARYKQGDLLVVNAPLSINRASLTPVLDRES